MALTLLICIWACCIVYHFELFALLPKTKKKQLYKMIRGRPLLSLRWRSLAAGPSPYCLMTSRLRCVQLINRPTAPSPTLRWPSLMQCTSTWENPRPSSSVPQVRQRGSPTTKKKKVDPAKCLMIQSHWTQPVCSFCPDYCASFCTPTVSQSSYLHTVGEKLLPGIDILWTGEAALNLNLT